MDAIFAIRQILCNGINGPKGMHLKTFPHILAQTGYFQLILLICVLLRGRPFSHQCYNKFPYIFCYSIHIYFLMLWSFNLLPNPACCLFLCIKSYGTQRHRMCTYCWRLLLHHRGKADICDRNCMAHKGENIYHLALSRLLSN